MSNRLRPAARAPSWLLAVCGSSRCASQAHSQAAKSSHAPCQGHQAAAAHSQDSHAPPVKHKPSSQEHGHAPAFFPLSLTHSLLLSRRKHRRRAGRTAPRIGWSPRCSASNAVSTPDARTRSCGTRRSAAQQPPQQQPQPHSSQAATTSHLSPLSPLSPLLCCLVWHARRPKRSSRPSRSGSTASGRFERRRRRAGRW